MLSKESNPQIELGKVLRFPYIGLDWNNTCKDSYLMSYNLQDNTRLYSFVIPADQHNNTIQRQMLENAIKYQNILGKYGYYIFLNSNFRKKIVSIAVF
jgi:hypothetical protein